MGAHGQQEAAAQIVRAAFLVRLAALVAGMAGLVGRELTGQIFLAVLVLAAFSFAGLSQPRAVLALVRHPLLAISDVVVVLIVIAVLGVTSPLALAGLSTALLVGLLYPVPVAALVGGTLITGYLGAAFGQHPQLAEDGSFVLVSMPVTLACLIGVGHSIRRLQESQREAVVELEVALRASASVEERGRLAREIHDSLAKSLQGVAATASALPAWLDRDQDRDRAGDQARELARTANLAVDQARGLMSRMRADDPLLPFHEVLASAVDAWSGLHGRVAGLQVAPVAVAPDARYELLGAVREALENVHRHAPDVPVSVTLEAAGGMARVVISDTGPGFDLAELAQREADGHFGVRGMRERLATAGGRLLLETRPGAGTRVTLEVPLAEPSGPSKRQERVEL